MSTNLYKKIYILKFLKKKKSKFLLFSAANPIPGSYFIFRIFFAYQDLLVFVFNKTLLKKYKFFLRATKLGYAPIF